MNNTLVVFFFDKNTLVVELRFFRVLFRYYNKKAILAQPVERMAFNHVVVGSIPTDGALD